MVAVFKADILGMKLSFMLDILHSVGPDRLLAHSLASPVGIQFCKYL